MNHGHPDAIWHVGDQATRRLVASYYAQGLERVAARAKTNGFRIGVPFIWCSNNLMVALATQAFLYRRMTGDSGSESTKWPPSTGYSARTLGDVDGDGLPW